ncbi:MAG: DUF4974 domain-containing protein [Chlorobi bacterium]|nr:DUF4974 domain-containing protein [Chlorobiota bacterium]
MSGKETYFDPVALITCYLSGEISEEETLRLRAWMARDPQHRELFEQYRKLWEKSGTASVYQKIDTAGEWKKLEERLDKIDRGKTVLNAAHKTRTLIFRLAAVLVIAIIAGFMARYLVHENTSIQLTAGNSVQDYTLPDGSAVSLNAGSTLTFKKKFNKNGRRVSITGEVYFDVVPDEKLPFVVEADKIRVTVLGTAFTINAQHPEDGISVVVDRGRVSMANPENNSEVILTPGEEGRWNNTTGKLVEYHVSNPNYLAWKNRHIVFQDIPLSEGLKTLEDVYHINLQLNDTSAALCHVTAVFDNEPLDSVLDVLAGILDLSWEQTGDTYLLSGHGCQQ